MITHNRKCKEKRDKQDLKEDRDLLEEDLFNNRL
jgi:hypothetical protein